MTKPNYCESAGLARACGDCRHNPMNQRALAKGQPIKPTIPSSLKCPHWATKHDYAITPSAK